MDIQKEVEKFEKKRSRLTQEFVHKMTMFVNAKFQENDRIDKAMQTLDKQRADNELEIDAAKSAIDKT